MLAMRSAFSLALFLCLLRGMPLFAQEREAATEQCTVGVACGRATADGRPLLWKNRDAHKRDNVVMALTDGKIPYLALCDAGNSDVVWGGANQAGFCVINAVARDLPQGSTKGPGNGGFMKLALQQCESVAHFEELLTKTNETGRRTRANFGVIDAHGAAAFFEAGHTSFVRCDADQSDTGMLVRTNFATTAAGSVGRERFARAAAICRSPQAKSLTPRFVLQQLLRDLQAPASAAVGEKGLQDVRETIHRQTTVAALVLHGVKQGEDPQWTTMWAVLGQPLFSMAVPLWPASGVVPPVLAGNPRSALCEASKRLADAFYVANLPSATDPEEAAEAEQPGAVRWLRQDAMAVVRRDIVFGEADILARYDEAMTDWRAAGAVPKPAALRAFQEGAAQLNLKRILALANQHAPVPVGK